MGVQRAFRDHLLSKKKLSLLLLFLVLVTTFVSMMFVLHMSAVFFVGLL